MSTIVALEFDPAAAASSNSSTAISEGPASGSSSASGTRFLSLCKGAPEEIATRLARVPAHYHAAFQHFSLRGHRVLALAFKDLSSAIASAAHVRSVSRAAAESQLTFAGFLVLSCPLKPDSMATIAALRESSHRVAMITGDHALTACQVAAELGITARPTLILTAVAAGSGSGSATSGSGSASGSGSGSESSGSDSGSVSGRPLAASLRWESPDATAVHPFAAATVDSLARAHDLCMTGAALALLSSAAASGLLLLSCLPFRCNSQHCF